MSKRTRLITAGLTVAGLLLAACGDDSGSAGSANEATAGSSTAAGGSATTVAAPSKTPYKIGLVLRVSGPGASSYVGAPTAASSWEKWVNANGGIDGHPVQVLVKDSAGDAGKGLTVTKELVENDKVSALMPLDPTIDPAILPYMKSSGVPVLSSFAAYPFWNTTPGWFALGISQTPYLQMAMVDIANTAGKKTLAAVVCAEVASCADIGNNVGAQTTKLGMQYDGTIKVAATAPNYTAECLSLKNKATQALVMGVAVAISTRFIADCQTQSYNPTMGFPSHAFSPPLAAVKGLESYGALPVLPWYVESSATKDFHDAITKYGDPSKEDLTSMYVWTTMEFIRQGLAQAKLPDSPTSQQVMDAMYAVKTNLGGLVPNLSFTPGQPSPTVKCYFYGGLSGGKFSMPKGNDPICPK